MSFQQSTVDQLTAVGLDVDAVRAIVGQTLIEDLGGPRGVDVTSVATIPEGQHDSGVLVARAAGVLAGLPVAAAVFDAASGGAVSFTPHREDATVVMKDDVLATITGPTQALLTAERSALNLLSRISGVATHTWLWANELAGTGAKVLDTRKTTPGLRVLEKYGVRCGGGGNKRMGLYDAAMIKDNHKLAAGGITAAFRAVRARFPELAVEVEVTTVDEAVEAVAAGADYLLCDNMPPELLREVVAAVGGKAELEATGGLTVDNARVYAETGVGYLSVGALTHSSPILDIAFDLRMVPAVAEAPSPAGVGTDDAPDEAAPIAPGEASSAAPAESGHAAGDEPPAATSETAEASTTSAPPASTSVPPGTNPVPPATKE